MPRKITKYLCEFKCGRRAVAKESDAQAHESKCWKNPANETCKTCVNQIYEYDSDGFRDWIYRGCKIAALDDMLGYVGETLKGKNQLHIRPIQHCKYYNRQADENVEHYAGELGNLIQTHQDQYFLIDWDKIK